MLIIKERPTLKEVSDLDDDDFMGPNAITTYLAFVASHSVCVR
jgi:hypothetical protein